MQDDYIVHRGLLCNFFDEYQRANTDPNQIIDYEKNYTNTPNQ